jgi:hypothetical protein
LGERNGTAVKIFVNNNYDYSGEENQYFVKNTSGNTIFVKDSGFVQTIGSNQMIPVSFADETFSYEYAVVAKNEDTGLHDVTYTTQEISVENMTQFYSIKRDEIDLMTLNIEGSDVLGTGATTKSVPLYKLLKDCFSKDIGNVLYRSGFSEDIPASFVKTSGYTGIKHSEGRKIITLTVEYDGAYSESDAVNDINQIVGLYNESKPSTVSVDTKEAVGIMDDVINNHYLKLALQ